MNRDDIIRMAREAGMRFHKEAPTEIEYFYVYPDALEHFANLVANHVLVQPCCGNFEKCQRLCMPRAAAAERKAVLEMIDELVGMERDRNTMFSDGHDYALHQVKEFVLARGQR